MATKKKWIQAAKLKEGSFSKQAKDAGMDAQAFANKVLANPDKYSTTTIKRANLAKNFAKMSKSKKK
jgi:hypothetical protein